MTKGDILFAIDTERHFHAIVFLETIDNSRFRACILSSKPTYGNLLMQPSHFLTHDINCNSFRFRYRNSHLVINYSFIKMNDWVNTNEVIGKLSADGIRFVESNVPAEPIFLNAPIWER